MEKLTNAQKAIWDTEQYYKDTSINNICGTAVIQEQINIESLKKAIREVCQKHDIFKTKLLIKDGEVRQEITETELEEIEILNISDLEELEKLKKQIAQTPLDIEKPHLYKFYIFKFKDNTGGYILNIHHIIADGWSLGLICNEITKIYSKLISNQKYENEEIYTYFDYINAEKEYLKSEKFEKDKKYWNEKYSTIPEVAVIPNSKDPHLSKDDGKGERIEFELEKEIVLKLKEYCNKNKISLYNFFMAIYAIYISEISNLSDFAIGTPILNRTNAKEKKIIGMLINMQPLRINMQNVQDFKTFIKNIAVESFGMLKHQKYSYQCLLKDLREKTPKLPNLYSIILSYQITNAQMSGENIKYKSDWTFNGCSADNIGIHISDINDCGNLNIAYDYKTSLYDEKDIKGIHYRVINIMNQVIEKENIDLKDIEIVTEAEKEQILTQFNSTGVEYPKNKTVVDLFEEQVKKTPNNIAVVFEDKKITYNELNMKSNSLANYLQKQGIKPGSIIAIRMHKKLEMIIGILAIIKAGCTYLPINMQYPEDRVNFMIKDSNAQILLGTEETFKDINLDIKKINIDLSEKDIYECNNKNLNVKISPEDLIYIIYTSGSTGTPKGAMLCHRNVVRLLKNDKFLFDFNENDTWTMFHSFAFDFSVWEMYGALLYGGKLVLIPDYIAQDSELFLNLLRKENVTVLNQTPTYFYKLQRSEMLRKDSNLKIRYIIFGGEALLPNRLKPWKNKYNNTKLINMYGITETTVHTTFKELTKEELNSSTSNIGIPIPTLHMIIVNKNMKLMPYGTVGELCVLGEGVFKGYLNREDLNKTKLIIDKRYSNKPIYRSGDTAVFKDDHFEYFGRIDTQVKIRGFRVELGEIEEKIIKCGNIETCIVAKKIDEDNREMLCAYYIKNGPINISELKQELAQHLPNYMIPQYFIEIEKVPINVNGKTDFKALPLPKYVETKVEIQKPRNETDEKLIEIYKKHLHIENIGINDSFFDLGGDSLVAISISISINEKFNAKISVRDILQSATIADLSDFIVSNRTNIKENLTIPKAEQKEFYPLSSAQKRMYLTSKMDEESNLYNITGGLIMNEFPEITKFENAINKVIEKHESLRTYFSVTNDGEIVQKIKKSINVKLNAIEEEQSNIDKIFEKYQKKFDLNQWPLFNTNLIKTKDGKVIFMLDVHHTIFDGSSLNIFLDEILKNYNGEKLEDLKINYKDFAVWENKQLSTNQFKESKEFWKNQFNDEIPILNMPTQNTRPIKRTYEGNTIVKTISQELTEKIEDFAKQQKATPYMIMLTAYYILLYRYTGQEDIIVGAPISGRKYAELEKLIGMFVNSLPLRQQITPEESFTKLLNDVKLHNMECFEHQDYPFDELVNELNVTKDASRNPLFDVMFIYQNNLYQNVNLDKINASYYIPKSQKSKMDLTLEVIPIKQQMRISFEYWTKLFEEKFIRKFAEHYCNILEEIINNPEIAIKDIEMLNKEEKNKIVYEFNKTQKKYNDNINITEMIEQIANKMPDKTAVIFENEKINYKNLNEKANQLAQYIKNTKINENSKIGIMLPRSIEMVYTILAIRKLGMCFIPIDYTYPKERIDYMLEESEAQLLITNDTTNDVTEFKNKLNIDQMREKISKQSKDNVIRNVQKDEMAYIIYTSGSTGKPKGVKITNKNLVNLVIGMKDAINLVKNKTIVSLATVCFDMFEFEFWGPLTHGLTLVIANEEEQNNGTLINELCIKNNVNIIETTPSKFSLIFKEKENMKFLENITDILVGGEPLDDKLLNTMKTNSNARIFNMYGPTETTVWSTSKDITNEEIITIGKPIANTQVYVLDNNLNVVPIGVSGELCISGDGVGQGYLNRPNLTNEKYINNPFIENSKMYRTGDMCTFDEKGELHCLGRIDNQIKIRGLRIELDEIEKCILEYPNIENCMISSHTDEKGRQFIVAYITVTDRISTNKLRSHLKTILPQYMIPSYFMILEKMPYLKNGKINKKALPKPKYIKDTEENVQYVAPTNKIEFELANMFQSLLGIYPIGIDDNFFELGGDSLLAMQLQVNLLKLNYKITYADIFMKPTIRGLEEIIINNKRKTVNYIMDMDELKTINEALKECCKMPENIEKQNVGNILLAGATGFLGIHLLKEFLEKEQGKIYCIIRSEPGVKAEEKLKKKLHFYFGNTYDKIIKQRVIVIDSQITDINLGLNEEQEKEIFKDISAVVNCAAKVTHYGNYNDFKIINVDAVENMVKLCIKHKKKFYHISTESVSGKLDEKSSTTQFDKVFKENDLYIKQNLDNVYARSKFEAEKIILKNISQGLEGYIFRMGNLTNRYSDGKFQSNIDENAFVNRLLSYFKIGSVSNYISNLDVEMTPIDESAKAIIILMQHKLNGNRVFHLHNHKYVKAKEIIESLKRYKTIRIVDDDKFKNKINKLYSNENSKDVLSGILQDIGEDGSIQNESLIDIKSDFSVEYLRKIGFEWSIIDSLYINQLIDYLRENGYFID